MTSYLTGGHVFLGYAYQWSSIVQRCIILHKKSKKKPLYYRMQ